MPDTRLLQRLPTRLPRRWLPALWLLALALSALAGWRVHVQDLAVREAADLRRPSLRPRAGNSPGVWGAPQTPDSNRAREPETFSKARSPSLS